ncbi:MAG: endonuclease III domain-containing protein [Chloroflexia bacterium]
MIDINNSLREKALAVHRRLVGLYGEPPRRPKMEPVAALVSTILSQNTSDGNRDRAFARLRERFPTWEAVRDAPVEAVEEAIRPAGLSRMKAPRIQAALRRITEEGGRIALDFLAEMPLSEARAWLSSFPGVGPKTAAIVLLFAFGRPAFPVDTHIYRLGKRLGLLPPNVSRERAHFLLEELLPPETYLTFHLNLIRHGREVCHAQRPACRCCLLLDLCLYGPAIVQEETWASGFAPLSPSNCRRKCGAGWPGCRSS